MNNVVHKRVFLSGGTPDDALRLCDAQPDVPYSQWDGRVTVNCIDCLSKQKQADKHVRALEHLGYSVKIEIRT